MSQQVSCPNCGSPVAFGVRFCGNCGTGLSWPRQQQATPQYQQQRYDSYSEGKHKGEPDLHEEHHPTKDTLTLCNLIKLGKTDLYLNSLREQRKEDVIEKFLDIIYTKDSFIPILFQEETPPVKSPSGISMDSLKNRLGRRMTKLMLFLLVASESKKLGIWNQIQEQWTEKYKLAITGQVKVMEAIVQQLDDNGQGDEAVKIRKAIAGIKEANKDLVIEW
jgi:hypothetical protein